MFTILDVYLKFSIRTFKLDCLETYMEMFSKQKVDGQHLHLQVIFCEECSPIHSSPMKNRLLDS